jgi:valyl-tRNA synthetase
MMFSNVFQDILARWHRIQGLLALFLTGIHQARNVMVSILCSARAGCLRV